MKKIIKANSQSIGDRIFIVKDAYSGSEEEYTLDELCDSASCYVNDTDWNWEYNTPELFSNACLNRVYDMVGYDVLTDEEEHYVLDQTSRGDFGPF